MTLIDIVNASTLLTDAQIKKVLPALQTQITRDFAPAYGLGAKLGFVPKGGKSRPGAWQIAILDNSDVAGALGYHDVTVEGLPLGKVFAATDKQFGLEWTITLSHELLEMVADPAINLTVFVQSDEQRGRLFAYEVCDPCEADRDGYTIGGVRVSDFVLPAWFEPWRRGAKYDYMGKLTAPLSLLPGGYASVFDLAGVGWTQVLADKVLTYRSRPPVGSRRERRRTPRSQWVHSVTRNTGV